MQWQSKLRMFCGYSLLLLVSTVFLTGCWDAREIQNRNFVLAAAIDVAEEGNEQGTRLETFAQGSPNKPLRLSLQLLALSSPGQDSAPGKSRTYVVSDTGRSVFEMVRDMLGQVSKPFWFEHMQVIIISEAAVSRHGLNPLLDLFRRDAEMRWRNRIYITPQEARKFLYFEPPTGEPGGIYLSNISKLYAKAPQIVGASTDLGATIVRIDNKADVILPAIELVDKQVKINSAAVFKKDKFVGYWDEYTVKGAKLLLGLEKSALIAFECPLHPGAVVVFELFRHDTYMKSHVENDQISFTVDIAMRGNVGEVVCALKHDTSSKEYMEKLEELIAQEVKRNIQHSFRVMQSQGIDNGDFGLYLKAYEPETWEKVKERWDDVFPTVVLNTNVRIAIQLFGDHK